MANYDFEDKQEFTVLGIGVELKSDYRDQEGLNQEKEDFFNQVIQNGTVAKLKEIAKNDYLFVVNDAVDYKMMHYIGVETDQEVPEATRMIPFPAGKYIVVPGEASSQYALTEQLTNKTFSEVLYEEKEYSYVDGPNAAVIMGEAEGIFVGEMWVPVIKRS